MQVAPTLCGYKEPSLPGKDVAHPVSLFSVQVRPYREDDRDEVRRICCETGFLGNPIDEIYRDRELFADLITNPYLDHEPEWSLVAESGGRVAGYITGSVDPRFHRTLMLNGFNVARKMLQRLFTRKYADHPRSEQYVRWVFSRGMKEQPRHPEGAAHLHINLEKPLRRGLIALRIQSTFEKMLLAAGIDHYYGKFFSCPQRNPEHMYDRLGFQVFDRIETTIFQPEITDTVYVVCIHKKLRDPARHH